MEAEHAGAAMSPQELERRLAGLQRLLDATRSLAAELDLETVLGAIAQQACDALDCERASVFQYDAETQELFTKVVTELEIDEIRRPATAGISGRVARTRAIANIADPGRDPDWTAAIDRRTGFQTRNILAAPLASARDGALLGVIELLNKQGGPFDAIDERLLEAFSQHAAVALDRARLVEQLRQREATIASLEVARQVQQSFMPERLLPLPGYELATWWFPNEAVGGDYCDVLPLADGRIGLVMADVSGHGLGPSLMMASVRAALRALVLEHESPDVLLRLIGQSLAADLQNERFITIILAALDAVNHTLRYANAGHGPAFVYRAANGQFEPLEATGLPLGVVDPPEVSLSADVGLQSGDLVFLCTDGVVDADNAEGVRFGTQRLEDLIRRHATLPVQKLVETIGHAVEQHYTGDSPPDDLTILAARRLE